MQVATKIELVYDMHLPAEVCSASPGPSCRACPSSPHILSTCQVRTVLNSLSVVISFGIDGIPLACIGADGYFARLLFWTIVPLVFVALCFCGGLVRALWQIRKATLSVSSILAFVAPIVLRLFFLCYAMVTNVAFEAFSCYDFDDGSRYLIADVSIVCDSAEHGQAKSLAWTVICVYSVGLIVLYFALLHCARRAILSKKPTALSHATRFLHREFEPRFYWYAALPFCHITFCFSWRQPAR